MWPQNRETHAIVTSLAILIAAYAICLLMAVHNIIRYLIIGARWHILLMSAFYIIIVTLLITRICSLAEFIRFYLILSDCKVYAADELDTIATYVKAILGI